MLMALTLCSVARLPSLPPHDCSCAGGALLVTGGRLYKCYTALVGDGNERNR